MLSFLEYLEEEKRNRRLRKEDAVMSTASAATGSGGGEIAASPSSTSSAGNSEVISPVPSSSEAKPCYGLTDKSILGGASSKKKKDAGFFGKDDFRIPKNVLSGEIETRIPDFTDKKLQ